MTDLQTPDDPADPARAPTAAGRRTGLGRLPPRQRRTADLPPLHPARRQPTDRVPTRPGPDSAAASSAVAPRIPPGSVPRCSALLVGTGVLYLWGLGASGWGNSFYSAAVQAGTKSWKAFFFGSFDSSNFITVDKPPAALWVMELSARVFGLNSWSVLVPQALEGVATVGLLYLCVRRWFPPGRGAPGRRRHGHSPPSPR